MSPERTSYEELIESLADGEPIDWASLDARATTDREKRRFRNLRLVARIAELHRTMAADPAADPSPPQPAAAAAAPDAWGHLRIERRISAGAFGEVYVARDPQLDRDVALKLLRPGASQRPIVNRLLAEAQMLARVRHPNVVTVHGADVREGRAGLWMDLVNGRTLEDWLHEHGQLGAGEAVTVGQDICGALAAVHAAGLVHGDIKAQNVMREDGGRIVLMDFGSVHAQDSGAASAGTPVYLAPEVLAGEPATARSDIYGVGVLLFHLLTGRYPVFADDLEGLRAAHAAGDRRHLRDLRPDLPAPLVETIERALESDPAMRFATAGGMERALARPRERVQAVTWWKIAAVVSIVALGLWVPRNISGPAARPIDSVAVLPFAGVASWDADLMEGLASDIVRELQRFDVDIKRGRRHEGPQSEAGEPQVDADVFVRGAVSADGRDTRLRLTLSRAGGAEVWSKEWLLAPATLPALPRKIAAEVADAVGVSARRGTAGSGHQTNSAAYEAYLRGRALWERRDPQLLYRSVEYFKQAAMLDAQYAQPWAGMADAYIALGVRAFGGLTPMEARRLAKDAALRAIEIDPNLAEAHTSLAFTAFLHDWDWATAEQRFQRAFELNPQYPLAHHWYAEFLNEMGRFDEAMGAIRRAEALDPLSVLIHRDVGWHLFCQRQYDAAIKQLQETLTLDPTFVPARTLLARALAMKGRYTEALAELDLTRGALSRVVYLSFRGHIEADAGDRTAAERSLAELRRLSSDEYVPPYYLALIHTALGRRAEALTELERSYTEQDPTLVTVNIDPRFDPIRNEPRFRAILQRMRFPEPQR